MSEWTNFNNVDDIFRSSTEGLPDNHIITVRERRLDVDIPDLIQNNIKTDTITLDLDAEWEGITPVIILGSADDAVEVYYNGDPVTMPSQVTKEVGWVDCSVTGYDATGTVRLVTVAAPNTFQVIESGLYTGEVPEEEGTSLLGQLLDAAKDAQAAADSAEDKIETIDTKLTEVDTKLTQVDTKLTEVDTKVNELTTVAGNAQKAAQNAQTAAETAQKAAEDAESSVTDAIFMDATAEKPAEKFLTDTDGNVLQDVYLTTANGVGDKEQYVNIGRSGEINGVVVHGGRAHAQLWTRASVDGQHDAYLTMYDTLEDGTQRAVLQAGYQNENTHVMLWDRDNPDARSGSFQPNRLVMADIENDAQADFKPTVGYFDSSGSQAIVMVTDPGENGINAVMGFGNSDTGKVLSRIGVTDGTSVLELNDHTVNDISLDSFADAENPSNKNLVTEKAVKAAIDAIPEALPEGGTEGQVLTKTAGGKAWQDIPEALPSGGTEGQVLTKTADGEAWQDAPEPDMTNVAKIVGNQLVSYDGSSIDYVNVRGEDSDSYGRVSGMGGIGFVAAGTGNDFIRLKSDSSGQCIGIRKDGIDTEYTISDEISEGTNTLATGKAVADYVEAQTKKNILISTATGKVAHAEDAFAEKPREVRIKGKTWVNRWPVINATNNGITVTTDETGLITVTGTATASANVFSGFVNVKRNSAYYIATTLPTTSVVNSTFWCIIARADTFATIKSIDSSLHGSFTSGDYNQIICSVYAREGQTVNASFRVMLVDGTEPPDCFTPPASIASVETGNLVTAGKNLVDFDDLLDMTVPNLYYHDRRLCPMLPVGAYTVSFDAESTVDNFYTEVCYGSEVGIIRCIKGTQTQSNGSVTLSFDVTPAIAIESYLWIRCVRYSVPTTYTYSVKNLQLELGSTATAYEPPSITTTTLPEVELRSLPNGTCDELVIKADGTCEVERRTQLSGDEVTELPEPTTEPQSPVTLPVLPAPTFNVYHDSDVPSETSVTYENDVNITISNMQKTIDALLGGN